MPNLVTLNAPHFSECWLVKLTLLTHHGVKRGKAGAFYWLFEIEPIKAVQIRGQHNGEAWLSLRRRRFWVCGAPSVPLAFDWTFSVGINLTGPHNHLMGPGSARMSCFQNLCHALDSTFAATAQTEDELSYAASTLILGEMNQLISILVYGTSRPFAAFINKLSP